MNNPPLDPKSIPDLVELHDGKAVANSLKIAEVFEKEHKHVIRDIKDLDCSEKFSRSNFGCVEYADAKGEKRPSPWWLLGTCIVYPYRLPWEKTNNVWAGLTSPFSYLNIKLSDAHRQTGICNLNSRRQKRFPFGSGAFLMIFMVGRSGQPSGWPFRERYCKPAVARSPDLQLVRAELYHGETP